MFCPVCRLENNASNQFCRSCGTDLRPARLAVAANDPANARELVARALSDRIKRIENADDLSAVASEVLPEIEKFLESPEEKKLRRQRTGMLLASIGTGVTLGMAMLFLFMGKKEEEFLFLMGLGIVTLFIGLGFLINATCFSLPAKKEETGAVEPSGTFNIEGSATTNELRLPEGRADEYISVTEPTTRQLEKSPIAAKK